MCKICQLTIWIMRMFVANNMCRPIPYLVPSAQQELTMINKSQAITMNTSLRSRPTSRSLTMISLWTVAACLCALWMLRRLLYVLKSLRVRMAIRLYIS